MLSYSRVRRAHAAAATAALLFGMTACGSDGGSLPRPHRTQAPPIPQFAPTVGPLTQDQARRSVLTPEDVGPGWSAGALEDGVPGPGDEAFPKSAGSRACDKALDDARTGATRVTVGVEREFEQDGTGVKVIVSTHVHSGDGAVVQLRWTRAMVESCGDVDFPVADGAATIRYRAIAAPVVGDEAVGMRMVMRPGVNPGTAVSTGDIITVRVGPNTVTLLVVGDAGLDPVVLERLARRAGERLVTATRE
ncbi:hypothetical protein [Embleya sp. NBC_00888]|uniref:hypothetical protein n=1 Tax=Embleya sp. NBC_00888 TaxID=2975960 RepID=UPI002F916993